MIGRLSGIILDKRPPTLLLEVHGVGYELDAPMTTFYELPATGESTILYTHMVVREDAQLLFAFSDAAQRDVFRSLLKVSGVGPRVALAILSTLSIREFIEALGNADVARLTCVPGIGRKTAERLMVEMRDRVLPQVEAGAGAPRGPAARRDDPMEDAVGALIALGYKAPEASRVLRGVDAGGLSSEELIRQALRQLAGAGR